MTAQEEEQNPIPESTKNQMVEKIAVRLWAHFVRYRLLLIVGLLAFWLKIVYTSSIDMWDEGWFVSIASRIADGLSDPFLPLYYRGNNATLQLFDKPPFAFIFGALLMNIFGKSTFGANGMNAIGGAGLAVVIYLLFSHQKETKSAHAIAGLLVALASFLNFYSRTAYIDPFVIFMGSIVFLTGIRAIDAIFVDNNLKKGYLLITLTGILNVLNVMTKAWQGVLIEPSIAIYLV
ncbi:MAG: glycosyltransferase family 39 protein, partial [Candidatus Heimdallarchaeota archaeon]|nr:glycosyltransferase family 39 protein [Candidatus Heimdallarchaeota archaeon]